MRQVIAPKAELGHRQKAGHEHADFQIVQIGDGRPAKDERHDDQAGNQEHPQQRPPAGDEHDQNRPAQTGRTRPPISWLSVACVIFGCSIGPAIERSLPSTALSISSSLLPSAGQLRSHAFLGRLGETPSPAPRRRLSCTSGKPGHDQRHLLNRAKRRREAAREHERGDDRRAAQLGAEQLGDAGPLERARLRASSARRATRAGTDESRSAAIAGISPDISRYRQSAWPFLISPEKAQEARAD